MFAAGPRLFNAAFCSHGEQWYFGKEVTCYSLGCSGVVPIKGQCFPHQQAMLRLLHPLEEHVRPTILTVGTILSGCVLLTHSWS